MGKKIWKSTAKLLGGIVLFAFGAGRMNAEAAPMADGNWTLLPGISDEFEGTELDMQKWNNGIWYDVTSELAFSPDNVEVRDGCLVLKARREAYNGKQYTAAAVESKFEVPGTDSYVEVRAKALNKDANVLSAVWMQSSPLTKAMNPNPEIDIMETFDYRKMSSTLHIWKMEPQVHLQMGTNNWDTGLDDISADFHTYALERRGGKLKFYFDDQLTWEKSVTDDSFVQLSRHMVLSLEGHLGRPAEENLPGEFLIDYVRTYYDSDFNGIPEEGIYRLVNRQSGKVLAVSGASADDKAQLAQLTDDGSGYMRWRLVKNDDGTYGIQNAATGKFADLKADADVTKNGNKIIQYEYHGESNQRWFVVPTDGGYFRIVSALSGKAMCVKDASSEENAPVIQWTYEGSDTNDEWAFVK